MARHYLEALVERTHDALLARAAGRELEKDQAGVIRGLWQKAWNDAKDYQPYWMEIQTNLTGVANQIVIGRTPTGMDQPVVVAGMTSNAPAAGQLISLENETNTLQYQVNPAPPTGLFANVQATTERYFRCFPQTYVGANNALKLTSYNDPTSPITQLIRYGFMGNAPLPPSVTRKQADAQLDADFARRIEQMIAGSPSNMIPPQEFILQMDVPFTNTASEIVRNRRTDKFSRPILILGAQHDFLAKASIAVTGPTVLFSSMDTRLNWSLDPLPIWMFANFVSEPEQWIMFPRPILVRPNSQIRADFINGTGAGIVGTGTFHVFFLCVQL